MLRIEDRMRLDNENKTPFLFCIVLGFHYLCTQIGKIVAETAIPAK